MVIRAVDLISAADTEAHGGALYVRLHAAMCRSGVVEVSFSGIHTATSSFVNAAFVPLLRDFSFSEIKRRLRVTNSTAQINDMLKRRLQREADATAVAA